MITLSLKKCRICLTFGFFFVVALTSLQDNTLGLVSLGFCILHELGHLVAMSIFGANVTEIRFYGAGISISSSGISTLPKSYQAIIFLSGPAVNAALALFISGDASALNLCLAVFNMLPIPYFDGGRLLSLIFKENSVIPKICAVLSYVFLGAVVLLAVTSDSLTASPSAVMTFVFIGLACILDR